jgi:hypothetical protein
MNLIDILLSATSILGLVTIIALAFKVVDNKKYKNK